MQTQCKVLGCRTDFYFHDYKLAIKIDENKHSVRILTTKKIQKAIEPELACKFVRIDTDKEELNIFKATNEVFR